MAYRIANGILFNLCWLAVVGSESALLSWGLAIAVVTAHLYWFGKGMAELRLVLLVAVVGLLLDQLLFASGLLRIPGGSGFPPLWLSALWPLFAITLLHAFAGLGPHPWLAALLGAVAGYASYRLGATMSAIEFGDPLLTGVVLALLWAILFPLYLHVGGRLVASGGEGAGYAR